MLSLDLLSIQNRKTAFSLVMDAIDRMFRVRLACAHAGQTAARSRAHELRVDHQDVLDWQ
jgi:hypothetical protein